MKTRTFDTVVMMWNPNELETYAHYQLDARDETQAAELAESKACSEHPNNDRYCCIECDEISSDSSEDARQAFEQGIGDCR